jgi:hypothetical protein
MRNPKAEDRPAFIRFRRGANPKELRSPNSPRRSPRASLAGLAPSGHGRLCWLGLAFLLSVGWGRAQGQYSVVWSTVDGGGGTSTGAVYTVSGTLGQPDAGAMSGGQFSVRGGFWSAIAVVQTPGAPTLRLSATNGVVTIAWDKTAEGWQLEQTNALPNVSVPWPQVPGPYQSNGSDRFITLSVASGPAFFRLRNDVTPARRKAVTPTRQETEPGAKP